MLRREELVAEVLGNVLIVFFKRPIFNNCNILIIFKGDIIRTLILF